MADEATDQQTTETEEQSVETPEQESPDQAGADESGVSAEGTEEEQGIELLGEDEYKKLESNPAALRKALNKAATQKFQEIAQHRKVLEPWVDFIGGMETDPVATLREYVRATGIQLAPPSPQQTTEEQQQTLSQQITQAVAGQLGPEYEHLAERLAPAIAQVAQMITHQSMQPLRRQTEEIIRDSALREADNAMQTFDKEAPGWRKHEKEMVELSQRLTPGEGMSEVEYLRILHSAVVSRKTAASSIKGVLNKMTQSAKTSERTSTQVPASAVSQKAGPVSFREAAALASKGIRLED